MVASAQRLTQALAVLLAICVAAEAVSTPSLGDLLRQRTGSTKVSTASAQEEYGYDQYGIETKELCLQETEMKACGCKPANLDPARIVQPMCCCRFCVSFSVKYVVGV